ncbi:hypothetical protein IC229_01900 [Spirosoma sp. BT702]|uniref:Uncharacterized protein n=1 Tax=Spirosoma profusum TaxID=2771354 RepID=A0A927AT62_9BACT|nr:hypothetical protein [Spirosoma profusum]MBD2699372.1 hypothetical protein [Spirosoma profusum]
MPAAKRKVVVSLDTYLSILAVVSSFCAIGITFYQAYLQRTQQYASVMPVLDSYHTGHFDDGTFGSAMTITNLGLGPAFIDSVAYYYRQKRYDNIYDIIDVALTENKMVDTTLLFSDLWKDKVLPQGEKLYVYQTTNRKTVPLFSRRIAQQMRFVIYYRSVYGERWVLDSQNKDGRNRKLN